MAVSTEMSEFLAKINEEYISCAICLEQYRIPTQLPCLHTFCKQCLVDLVKKTDTKIICCPICQSRCNFDINDFKANHFMVSVIDLVNERSKFSSPNACNCDVCKTKIVSHVCLDCPQYFCETCIKAHTKIKVSSAHRVKTLQEYKEHIANPPTALTVFQTVQYCSIEDRSTSSAAPIKGASGYGYDYHGYGSTSSSGTQPGLCGLSNLGNTCFMNSAIQCMSNVPPLTYYFLTNQYLDELNYERQHGTKGEIAEAYANLIKEMWSGKCNYTVPRQFKMLVDKLAPPQFSGYQQQDSQKLLAFLIDGLHEDLNRIKKKPYIEIKDDDGRPDEVVAKESWGNHLKRNHSIIVDQFHGLFKSTLVCPECDKVSVTFDPFCFLSLPLPLRKDRSLEVFFICNEPTQKPIQMKVMVPKMGSVSDICDAVSKIVEIPTGNMVVTDVYNHRFHKVFGRDKALTYILDRDDIFVYEVTGADDASTAVLPVYMREKKHRYNYNSVSSTLFGQPLLIAVPRKSTTYQTLYEIVLHRMSRYVEIPDNEDWCEDDTDQTDNIENGDKVGGGSVNEENENKKRRRRLFTFTLVNAYGSADLAKLQDDDVPLKFKARTYLSMDWNMRAKRKFYDEKSAEEYDVHDSVNTRPPKKTSVKLSNCIDLFLKRERLGVDDPWYCPSCKEHRRATKKFDLWKLPKILVIHLKRFSYNRYWRDKLDTLVSFPTRDLDMKNYLVNNGIDLDSTLYDLIAVSNHYGGMGGGHYTAYAKSKDDEQWYSFDDSSVFSVSEDDVGSKAAYVLFYMRRDPDDYTRRNMKERPTRRLGGKHLNE